MPAPMTASDVVLEARNASNEAAERLLTLWAHRPKRKPGFPKDMFDLFDDVDRDHDGFIDLDDIDRACGNRLIKGHQAAAIATLRCMLDDLEDISDDEKGWENDGLTRADLAGLEMLSVYEPTHDFVTRTWGRYGAATQKIRKSPRHVFADEENPVVDPIWCQQGLMGDCFLLAPLISLAFVRPDDLTGMLSRRSQLEWRVTTPDAAVTVETPTDAQIALFASGDGLWPVLFELAYAKSRYGSIYGTLSSSTNDVVDTGGIVSLAITWLTGNSVDTDLLSISTLDATREKLVSAFAHQKIVAAGIRLSADRYRDHLPTCHAYSVIGYDAERDIVTLRNPWGASGKGPSGAPVVGGVFEMTLEAMDGIFTDIDFEE